MALMSFAIAESQPVVPMSDHASEVRHWAQHVVAWAFVEEVASAIRQPTDSVWQVMCSVPDNLLTLLDSPQGWTALCGYVSAELGVAQPDFMPVVH